MSLLDIEIKRELMVFLMGMMPIAEVRGAIPLGASLDLPPFEVIVLSILGNIFIVPILLLILGPIMKIFGKVKFLRSSVTWLKKRALNKTKDKIKKYRALGLFLFVAVPLPTTGVWTGCLAAHLLKVKYREALLAISCGVLVSASIVSVLTYGLIF